MRHQRGNRSRSLRSGRPDVGRCRTAGRTAGRVEAVGKHGRPLNGDQDLVDPSGAFSGSFSIIRWFPAFGGGLSFPDLEKSPKGFRGTETGRQCRPRTRLPRPQPPPPPRLARAEDEVLQSEVGTEVGSGANSEAGGCVSHWSGRFQLLSSLRP